jgi:capsid protein
MADSDPFDGFITSVAPPDPLATEARRILDDDFRRRLQRTEWAIDELTQMQREAACDWLGAMLHRPPLERASAAWRPMRAIVEALWWDIADRTPADPMDPDAGNERLVPNHPWGEGSEA